MLFIPDKICPRRRHCSFYFASSLTPNSMNTLLDTILDILAISTIESDAFGSHVVHPRIMFSGPVKTPGISTDVMYDCY